ncbi:calreticulin-3 isoform X1 [Lissotriton helveticus]
MRFLALLPLTLIHTAMPTVYFKEQFLDEDLWKSRWVKSKFKNGYGKFKLTSGKFYGNAQKDKGIQTRGDGKYYAMSSRFTPFRNEGNTLVIQFSIKHERTVDCGGGYVKLFPSDLDQEQMSGQSKYYIMFGPDICGFERKLVHVIFYYKGKYYELKKEIRCKDDPFTHLYTLIVRPNQTYEVKIDNEKVRSGNLETDFEFLGPKKIKDPAVKKPDDWDDRPTIDDPADIKPEDWDQPEFIIDTSVKPPFNWDVQVDGEWEPIKLRNPKYKGEWKPSQIVNPNFAGVWNHPEIDNPDYAPDPNIYKYENIGVIGLDLWQVRAGSIFDNFLITNNEEYADKFAKSTWGKTTVAEKNMKDKLDQILQEKRKRQEEERKQRIQEQGYDDFVYEQEQDDEDEYHEIDDEEENDGDYHLHRSRDEM